MKIFGHIVLLCSTLALSAVAGDKPQALKVDKIFPSEEQMQKFDFVLGRAVYFDADESAVYITSQMQHIVLKINHNGDLIKIIGRPGQGPGEFKFPLFSYLHDNRLFVCDIGNSRFQIFSLDGELERQIKMISGINSMVIAENKLFILLLKDFSGNSSSPIIFGKYDMNGRLEKYMGRPFDSLYNDFYNDNSQTIRIVDGRIHCLQQYGTNYRIYNLNGIIEKEIQLEINPLRDGEYQKTGWKYAYPTFAVDENKIYASCAWKGKIVINVFDFTGKCIKQYFYMREPDEIYEVSDMKFLKINGHKYLYLLNYYPDAQILVAEVK